MHAGSLKNTRLLSTGFYGIIPPMIIFPRRTNWPSESNPLSLLVAGYRHEETAFLDLTVSNPTQCGFQYYQDGLLKSLLNPKNLNYEPNPLGLSAAREAITAYYAAQGVKVDPKQIIITASTSEAYSFAFQLLFEPGELLLAPKPSYPLLEDLAALHDIRIERYAMDPNRGWEISLKGHYEMKEADPKALLLVNPNNPTGNYVHVPELAELNIFCKKRGVAVISDEVFFDYPLDRKPEPAMHGIPNRHNLALVMNGISKILGLPQMKLSWIIVTGPEPIACEALRRLEIISDTYLSTNTPVQNALPEWFKMQPAIQKEILDRIRNNYRFLKQKLGGGGSVRLFPVEAGWHAPLQLPSINSDEEWAQIILKKDRVLTHPGYLFDFEEGSYLIVSLIVPETVFQEGIEKIIKRAAAS